MSDIAVELLNWSKLKSSKIAFVPDLVRRANGAVGAFSNADLYRASQALGQKAFSQHVVGTIMNLEAVTVAKAEQVVAAYAGLDPGIVATHGPLTDDHIVIAALAVPQLGDLMIAAGMIDAAGKPDAGALAALSGVSERAISHALRRGRVTGGIACALHAALQSTGVAVPGLQAFATSDFRETVARKSIVDAPFKLSDLLLPVSPTAPETWE